MSVIKSVLIAAAVAAVAAPALAQSGGVRVQNAAARVVVIAENRSDYLVSINPGRAGLKTMALRRDGGVQVVDGGYGGGDFSFFRIGWSNLNCKGPTGREHVSVPGRGDVALGDLPVVTIHTPMVAHISASGAVYGEVSPTSGLDFANAGCGDWRIADVRGPARLAVSGSGDLRGANVGLTKIEISGSSDVQLGVVSGALTTHTAGSGDIRAASVRGEIATSIAGSGNVVVDGGDSPRVRISVSGSGDFKFGGTAGVVSVSIAGSGDVEIAHATGPVSKSVAGSGDVHIGG